MTAVTIPNSVKEIEIKAFRNCSSLTSITIPDSVKEIKDWAFDGCKSLASVTLPNSLIKIEEGIFDDCESLTSIKIPNKVKIIKAWGFNNCTGLTSITIPNSVTSIGISAFYGCYGLTSINVDSGNNNYSSLDGVLYNKLQNILIWYPAGKQGVFTIPNSVASINISAFYGCYGLTSINVDSRNNNYSSLDGVLYNKLQNILICYPTGKRGVFAIPNSVTSIGDYAFHDCTDLTSITIPNSVTSIGSYAFQGCIGLTSLTIPNSVNNIDGYAFRGCNILSITVPKNIDKIPFWDFPSLKEIYIQSVSLSNDDFNVVKDIDGVSYYVPVESYKSFSALAGKTVIVTKPETNKSANLLQWKGTTADWEVQTDYYSRGLFTNTETVDIYLFGKKINNN